jgi:RecB family endonuclease NucS
MPSKIKLWSVINGKLNLLQEGLFSDGYREKDLEEWIAQDTSLLGRPNLTVIGRQVNIPNAGILDLLAVENGHLVVVEFKRQQTTRDAIAQILDYASAIKSMTPE